MLLARGATRRPTMKRTRKVHAITSIAIGLMFGARHANAQLPQTNVQIDREHTALVVLDPQIDFLSPKGVTWGLVGKNIQANHTVDNIEKLFKVAKARHHESDSCGHVSQPLRRESPAVLAGTGVRNPRPERCHTPGPLASNGHLLSSLNKLP